MSDSPLSLHDIDEICEAFSDILKGVYHERIEYPEVRHYAMQTAASAGSETEESGKTPMSDSQETSDGNADIPRPEDETKEPAEENGVQDNDD